MLLPFTFLCDFLHYSTDPKRFLYDALIVRVLHALLGSTGQNNRKRGMSDSEKDERMGGHLLSSLLAHEFNLGSIWNYLGPVPLDTFCCSSALHLPARNRNTPDLNLRDKPLFFKGV